VKGVFNEKVFLIIILLIVLLFPIKNHDIDRTVSYSAFTYKIILMNQRNIGARGEPASVTKGTIIYILGFEIYNDTEVLNY